MHLTTKKENKHLEQIGTQYKLETKVKYLCRQKKEGDQSQTLFIFYSM